jgi:hypothetical protein
MRFTVEVRPPIALPLWNPQYRGDVPRWHLSVEASSPAAALKAMQGSEYRDMPMRIVPPLGT